MVVVPVPFDTIVVSGNDQTGTTSDAYPAPIVARVRDSAGQPVPGAVVRFETSVPAPFPSKAQVSFSTGPSIDVVADGSGNAAATPIANE